MILGEPQADPRSAIVGDDRRPLDAEVGTSGRECHFAMVRLS